MKKFFIVLLFLVIIIAGGVWFFRYDIFRFSAESLLKNNFPGNIAAERIVVDTTGAKIDIYGLRIANPAGFKETVFTDVGRITINYRMRGKTILSGIKVTHFEIADSFIRIERLRNGIMNSDLIEMAPPGGDDSRLPTIEFIKSSARTEPGDVTGIAKSMAEAVTIGGIIPGNLRNTKISFLDNFFLEQPFSLMFESPDSIIYLSLGSGQEITRVETEGSGFINNDVSQKLSWKISADLASEELILSTRVEPENVDIAIFKPYYDEYSPVNIVKGRVSGTVIFDMNRGNIGSDNLLRFRGLEFTEKSTESASVFWDTNITDIVKYLELASGEVVFDFKIKGSVKDPRFYPGPNVMRAVRNMAIDKIGDMLTKSTQSSENSDVPEEKSDVDKALDIFKGFLKQ